MMTPSSGRPTAAPAPPIRHRAAAGGRGRPRRPRRAAAPGAQAGDAGSSPMARNSAIMMRTIIEAALRSARKPAYATNIAHRAGETDEEWAASQRRPRAAKRCASSSATRSPLAAASVFSVTRSLPADSLPAALLPAGLPTGSLPAGLLAGVLVAGVRVAVDAAVVVRRVVWRAVWGVVRIPRRDRLSVHHGPLPTCPRSLGVACAPRLTIRPACIGRQASGRDGQRPVATPGCVTKILSRGVFCPERISERPSRPALRSPTSHSRR